MAGVAPGRAVGARDLCAFILRHGDLEWYRPGPVDLAEMGAAHAQAVAERGRHPGSRTEVTLKRSMGGVVVWGRADVVVETAEGLVVEEIKTTRRDLGELPMQRDPDPAELLGLEVTRRGDAGGLYLDWAQALVYAAMLAAERGLPDVTVLLRYVGIRGGQVELRRRRDAAGLEAFYRALVARYERWIAAAERRAALRDSSLEGLVLPFETPRAGQGELMQAVRAALHEDGRLFACAPTGIGKTAAVLVAALEAMPARGLRRLFYLTPRGTAAAAVADAVGRLRHRGLRLQVLYLAAREKVCPHGVCDLGGCRYARAHEERVLGALEETLTHETLDVRLLREMGERHRVCPHELGREAVAWCDLVVGDYNYVFDPAVALRAFQDPAHRAASEQVYLVDEAHQLAERAREWYGAALSSAALQTLARDLEAGRPELARALQDLAASFTAAAEACEGVRGHPEVGWSPEPPAAVQGPLETAVAQARAWLEDWGGPLAPRDALDRVMELLVFDSVRSRGPDGYATLMRASPEDLALELVCLDPAIRLREHLEHARSSVFFSATLTPPEHYARMLGGGRPVSTLTLRSPFPRENLRVVVDGSLTNRLRERPASAPRVARLVRRVVRARAGAYLVFLPSYAYLDRVVAAFDRLSSGIRVVRQTPGMTVGDREALLETLRQGERVREAVVGFVVLGGLFAESVDLPGEQLVGAIIAGTGLPPPTPASELERAYHEDRDGMGFERVYLYPGLSRVLQAAGRVIRGPTDRGVIVLADSRFADTPYREHLPPEWDLVVADGVAGVGKALEDFWGPVCYDAGDGEGKRGRRRRTPRAGGAQGQGGRGA